MTDDVPENDNEIISENAVLEKLKRINLKRINILSMITGLDESALDKLITWIECDYYTDALTKYSTLLQTSLLPDIFPDTYEELTDEDEFYIFESPRLACIKSAYDIRYCAILGSTNPDTWEEFKKKFLEKLYRAYVVNEIQIPGKVLARITLQEQREIRDRIQKDRAKAVEEGIINEIAGSFTAIITQSLEQSGAHPSFVDRNVKTVFERATGGISDFFEELDKLISEFAEQFPDPMDFLDEFFHPPMPDISRK